MTDVFRKLYNFIPLQSLEADGNEALREIDDSLKQLYDLIVSQGQSVTTIPNQFVEKFGFNDDIDTGSTPEDVWTPGGLVTWPSTAAVVTIASDDPNDTLAGSGAQKVTVTGVDSSYNLIEEEVNMNGTSNVTTTQTFLWVHRGVVSQVGATGWNEGTISLSISGNSVGNMVPEESQTQTSMMIVWNSDEPGREAWITNVAMTCGRTANTFAVIHLHTQAPGGAQRLRKNFIISNSSYVNDDMFVGPLVPGTRIWCRVEEVGQNNTRVHVDYRVEWVDPPG